MRSKRLHLFEFNDSSFCPGFLRDSIIEILGSTIRKSGFYQDVVPVFSKFCKDARCTEILDLCSGSGAPVSVLLDSLNKNGPCDITFYLSDISPPDYSLSAVAQEFPNNIRFSETPINALDVSNCAAHQARTIIAGFHHFRPQQAKAILADSVKSGKAIFIIEPFTRQLKTTLPFFIKSFIPGMLNPIRTRKDKLLKLLFTNIIPIVPLLGWWDTLVSGFRMYSQEEYMEMVVKFDQYRWEYTEIPIGQGGIVTVFSGIPEKH